MSVKKIVLITTGQPSCNPRIVKEADALSAAGYEVTVVYNYFIAWADENDRLLLSNSSWKYYSAGGSPRQNNKRYLFTRIRNKMAIIISLLSGNGFLMAERAQARAYDELLIAAKEIKADWYIGHNLGALAVAVNAAAFNDAKAGFDFEDYYRGETLPGSTIQGRITWLEQKYLPRLSYFSASSEMIKIAVQKDHPGFKGTVLTLHNCFPFKQQPQFKEKDCNDKTLQLFWFSQTVGINRGLEVLIDALKIINAPEIHLSLAGNCSEYMLSYIRSNSGDIVENIHFLGIIPAEELPSLAAKFDIGLALETAFSENNNIALSNKIFTYLLAGNAIILSETAMQLAFNEQYEIGESFSVGDKEWLVEKIKLYKNHEKLNTQKKHNYELAKSQFNWEMESKKLLAVIN